MPYDARAKQTMKGIAEITPAFSDFEHDLINHLSGIIGNLHLIKAQSKEAHIQAYAERAIDSSENLHRLFRELR